MNILELITFCKVKGMSIHHHELQHTNPVLRDINKENRKFFHVVIANGDIHADVVYDDAGVLLESVLSYDESDGRHLFTGARLDKVIEILLGSHES